MSFFGGMPQYYDRHDDPLNLNRSNLFNDPNMMHPGDARLHAMQRGGGINGGFHTGLQQGPRMHNPLMDPRVNSAGLADIDPVLAKAVYGREMLPRETAGLKFLQENAQQFDPRGVREMVGGLDLGAARVLPGNQEMLRGAPPKPNMGMRRGETPDGAILQEIMRRRRGR